MLNPTAFLIFQDGTPPPPLPAQPTGVSVTASSETQVRLDWTDNATDETSYEVQIDTDSGFGAPNTAQGLAVDLETYNFTGLVAGTQYYVRVRAVNPSGNGAWSASANTYTLGTPPTRPDSCAGFATSTSTMRQVWTDVGDEDHFELEYNSNSSFSGTSVTTTVAADVVHYDWTGVTSATWYLRVRGVSTTLGSSAWRGYSANSASGIYDSGFGFVRVPSSLASPPSAPTVVTDTINSATSVTVNWTEGSGGGFTKTELQVSDDASYQNTVWLAEDAVAAQTEVVTGLTANTTYYYRLRSQDGNNGDYSAWVTGTALTEPDTVPAAPAGLAVSTAAPTTLDFAWTDTPNAQITEVESQIAEDIGFSVGLQSDLSVGVGTEAKQWTGLTEGTSYYTRVRCINVAGNGAYNTEPQFTAPAAPTSLAETDNGTFWTLDWTRNSANNDAVEIWKDENGGGYNLFDTLGAAVITYAVAKEANASWKVINTLTGAPDSADSNVFADPT